MAAYFYIKITGGTSVGPYVVYYDQINLNNIALLYPSLEPAIGLTYVELTTNNGVLIQVPSANTTIYLYNELCNIEIPFTPYDCSTSISVTPVVDEGTCSYNYGLFEVFDPQNVTITFEVYFLTRLASGYIDDGTTQSLKIVKTVPLNTEITVSAIPTNSSTFIGWSVEQNTSNIIENQPSLTIIATVSTTYYAIIDKNVASEKTFCYFDNGLPENVCFCNDIDNTITVYYNTTQLYLNGFENITWYSDSSLTTEVPDGYYVLYDDANAIIYQLENGLASNSGCCGNNCTEILCSS